MGHRIKIIKNFVEPEDAARMISLIDAGPRIPFIDNPDPNISVLSENHSESQMILKKYSDKILDVHREEFGWAPPLYTTQCHASLWGAGAGAGGHTDSHTGSEHIIFSSVIYLGGEFTGGDIVFPNHNMRYHPEPLSAAIFPSGGWEYLHEVEMVTSGRRYTMPMWHTGDKMRGLSQIYANKGNNFLSDLWGNQRIAAVIAHDSVCAI